MLDINLIREKTDEVKTALLKRMKSVNLETIIKLDDERKIIITKVDEMKASRNKGSKGKPTPEEIEKMKTLGDEIKKLDDELKAVEENLKEKMAELPNMPADDVPAGGKENNQVVKTFGKKPEFAFEQKDHVELATSLDLIDYERAAKMSGNGFWIYKGDGALLEWALLNYFIEFHRNNNYTFIIPPYLLNEDSAYVSGHLPKFRDDLYWTQDGNCLNATSEMMLGNYHRDEILDGGSLPIKYYAYSTCFRREAGSYRKEERGMIRGHQFNKIEMFNFTTEDKSWEAFDEMVGYVEKLTEGLGLHYQTSLLAAGDASSAMAKTVDIEVWIPSMDIYKEVSSASNALDYQARRGNIRYKPNSTSSGQAASGNKFVHTLNASGLATSRLIPAILEQFQQEDGSVLVPEVLQKFVGKKELRIMN